MIIHSYFTDGFFPWAKLFIESYKYHNGENIKIILSTKELENNKINELYSLYQNLVIKNDFFDIEKMAKKANMKKELLLKYKQQIEKEHVTKENKIWKLMIAGDDRIKSILETIREYNNEDYILHFDIDMYIRSNLQNLIDFIKNHDISIRLRLNSKINRKTLISVQGYKICDSSINFLKKWIEYINCIPITERPLGYGQTSCYYAYEDFKDKIKWGDINYKYTSPKMNKEDIVWGGNSPKGKTKNLQLCLVDFNKIKDIRSLKNE